MAAKIQEPIARNVYRTGDALIPELDKDIFFGREDLKEELKNKVLSSPNMPMFLVHGQCGVGKTSLLKFLPGILSTKFKVVYMDMQFIDSIYDWLASIQDEFDGTLGIDSIMTLTALNNIAGSTGNGVGRVSSKIHGKYWLKTWKLLQTHLEEAAQKVNCKIILAFDEYEKIHYYFQKDPEAAENLLITMQNFSHQQNKIVFLFMGTALFSELKEPRWSNCFVQAVRLKVDYLDKNATFQLIDVAKLEFSQEILDRIYHLTRGHPTLVQKICHEMVNIANLSRCRQMTMKDLENILENHVYVQENGVTEVFWDQFCQEGTMKTTVMQIIKGEKPGDLRATFTLSQHGFIIKDKGSFKMRVPIFKNWIKKFGEKI